MKNKFIFLLLILFLLTGCYRSSRVVYEAVENPVLIRSPLEGRWVITKVVFLVDKEDSSIEELIGKEAIFSQDFAIFDSQLIQNPRFVMTKVNTEYFLKLRYNIEKMEAGVISDKLFSISILVDEREVFEVLREKEDVAYINIYGNLLQLIRTEEDISQEYIDSLMTSISVDEKYYSSTLVN